ncbi:hypothetical protein EU527_06050 [Candidatus Thorarchaeota archaeon]|nr:MAG: hypothetical protein EU527_06050 [Candidatus Thorarchaeota archaeon]
MNPLETLERVESLLKLCDIRCRLSNDLEARLKECEDARILLESLEGLSNKEEQKRLALLSQTLIQESYVFDALEQSDRNLERAKEALNLAKDSTDLVQIARAHLCLGIHLLNSGDLLDAEGHWVKILLEAQESHDDAKMQVVVGRTLIVRGHVLNAKGLFAQAIEVLDDAVQTLESAGDKIGMAEAYELMSKVYHNLNDPESTDFCLQRSKELKELVMTNLE